MGKKADKKAVEMKPDTAILIFQGALENLKTVGIEIVTGWDDYGNPVIGLPESVFLCPQCGMFSFGESCQHCSFGVSP